MKEFQRSKQTANREKRQELARMRQEANLRKVKEREGRSKERLKGKGLFYCESTLKRTKEIQLRLCEAGR